MSSMHSLPREYFDNIYAAADDPWSFADSEYEAEKYARTLAAIGDHYAFALEIGCSIGVFTEALARRCDNLLAVDISERAIDLARIRCAGLPQVHFVRCEIPRDFPAGPFDLITCCEVGYYWSDADFGLAQDRIAGTLRRGGDLILVHFLPKVADYVRPGDDVHRRFLLDQRFDHVGGYRAEHYRIDVVRRR